jgi:hypothetical protein
MTVFVIKKIRLNRKMTTEKDILKALRSGKIQLPQGQPYGGGGTSITASQKSDRRHV